MNNMYHLCPWPVDKAFKLVISFNLTRQIQFYFTDEKTETWGSDRVRTEARTWSPLLLIIPFYLGALKVYFKSGIGQRKEIKS
jgi:hypothetical protein